MCLKKCIRTDFYLNETFVDSVLNRVGILTHYLFISGDEVERMRTDLGYLFATKLVISSNKSAGLALSAENSYKTQHHDF